MTINDLSASTINARYQIVSRMGDGNMASVYKARDLTLNQLVAIKVLPQEKLDDETSVMRFQREGMALSRLNHPALVRVLDVGITEHDSPFIVMEYLAGESLAQILKREGKLEVARCSVLFGQICDGLQHAHEHNIVHRDLKPGNIMICRENNIELAKIVDFGIAKVFRQDQRSQERTLTRPGEIIGSPLYMSPEQCQGMTVDARSDQYSFGCILYECLSGTPPHVGASSALTLIKKRKEDVPTLQEASGGLEFPEETEALVQALLARDPMRRYENMHEVKEALRIALPKGEFKSSQQQTVPIQALKQRSIADEVHSKTQPGAVTNLFSSSKNLRVITAAGATVACLAVGWMIVHFSAPKIENSNSPEANEVRGTVPAKTATHQTDRQSHSTESDMTEPDKTHAAKYEAEQTSSGMTNLEDLHTLWPRVLQASKSEKNIDLPPRMSDTDLQRLKEAKWLETVVIYNNPKLTAHGLEILQSLPHLKRVQIGHTDKVTDDLVRTIAKVKTLISFKVVDCQARDIHYSCFKKCTSLERLTVKGLHLDDIGLRELCDLSLGVCFENVSCDDWTPLKKFRGNNIAFKNMPLKQQMISDLGKLPGLETIAIEHCVIDADCLKALRSSRKLQVVSLRDTNAHDEDVQALADLPELSSLDLSNTKITTKAMPILKGMRALRVLYITRTSAVTRSGAMQDFRAHRPDVKLVLTNDEAKLMREWGQ